MAKKIVGYIKLQIPAGKANPAPPIGPALGQKGVNIMAFCKEFNAKTQDKAGDIVPVVITVYEDKSFTMVLKSPPASRLILKEAGLEKGSKNALAEKVGKLKKSQVRAIVEKKKADLRAMTPEDADRMIEGTARSMGIEIVGG